MCEAETEEEQHKLHRADVQQLLVSKEEVPPEQQEWSPSLDQDDPPELPHIKEEQEELWTSQEGEQLRGLEEADITRFTFSIVPVKSEDDEEKPQSSQLQQSQTEENRDAEHLRTEADGEDCGGSEPTRNFYPDRHLQTATHVETSHFSEPETDDSCDLEETREPQSGLNHPQNNEVPVSEESNTGKTSVSSSECVTSFGHKGHLQKHNGIWSKIIAAIKSLNCSVCGKKYHLRNSLTTHVRLQSEGKHVSCSVCRPIAEYEEELCRQHKLLDAVLNPEVRLHRVDVWQLLVSKEEVLPEQQEWSPSQDQEDPPEVQHIKEEQEELWTSQEGEQLRGLEEADIIKFTFSPVLVKSEEDEEEKPQSSHFHQRQTEHIKTETDGEDSGGSEPARNINPDSHLQLDTHEETSDFSEPETDDSYDWDETREPQSGLNPLQNKEVPISNMECNTEETSISSSESATSFGFCRLPADVPCGQTGQKPFSCSFCGKRYRLKNSLTAHMRLHSERKRFSCSVCKKSFPWRGHVVTHMRIHTGEKPFTCSVCGMRFTQKGCLRRHSTVHIGGKPFSCSVCGKGFTRKCFLRRHSTVHTGEKPFSCSVCGKRFALEGCLRRHSTVHTGEKPFSCSVCGKRFALKGYLRRHSLVHTEEKPFSCSVCGKGFARKDCLRQHSTVHTGEKPFSCSVCGIAFALKGHLRRHSALHRREKPFSCSVCHKGFTQLTQFKKHKCVGESNRNK